jgi:hypothetical protein
MIALMPLPVITSRLIRGVQQKKMTMVRALCLMFVDVLIL